MLKQIYRIIILLAVFIAALFYFSGGIKEVVFDVDNTTKMEAATFPLVTLKTGDSTINLLHGYSSNLDADIVRESVTPLSQDKTFEIQIDQKEYDIKKLNYEVREFVGDALIETDSVSVFEENGDRKTAKIKLMSELSEEKECALKITLISSASEKMYFYQRIKIYTDAHLQAKLDFIMQFHDSIMDKNSAEDIIKYLEPSDDADNSSLAYVNINSSFDLVSWGNLKPTVLTDIIPTVKEIYKDTASVELNYFVQAEVNGAMETYRITEFYRVRYAPDRMYLLNYERYMDALFDISLASISKSELKLGITNDPEVPYKTGDDEKKVAFVRDRELWFYDLENNQATKVFSFRQDQTDYIRDLYDQHDIRILNMDAEGNLDFMVYGYMNRGQYEGRVAIILYHYYRAENRIEELVYIPVDEPYQILKEHIGDLSYVNSNEVFYFQVYNNIYSYDLITKKLSELASGVGKEQVKVLNDIPYAVWQENPDPKLSDNIRIMDLESGLTDVIPARQGYNIRLMDMIDSNIIYGFVNKEDIATMIDGSIMAPLSTVEIASVDKKVLKSYNKPGFFVSGLEVKDNIIELRRVQKVNEGDRILYAFVDPDRILNQKKTQKAMISVTSRITDQALTEYYMTLPDSFVMEAVPKAQTTISTIIYEDPTVRLTGTEQKLLCYYPYVTGGIKGSYENAAEAISIADRYAGVVWNNDNQIIWERGVKTSKNTISAIDGMDVEAAPDSTVESCLQLMLAYQGRNVSLQQLSVADSSAYEVLKKYSSNTPVRLTGATLDNVLYYVSEGRPVIAMTDLNDAVLIYGYDTFNITIVNPATGKKVKMGIQDSASLFGNAGNVFLSYLEQ